MKRILIGATLIVAGIVGVAGATPASAEDEVPPPPSPVCEPKESHIKPADGTTAIPVTAPEGKLISGYCVKSASINQGLGPEYVYFDEPVLSVTITYTKSPTEKDISHYVVFYVDAPEPEPVPVQPPTLTPPTCESPGVITLPTVQGLTYLKAVLANGTTEVTVTANPGYELGEGPKGPWLFTAQELAVLDCTVESEPPAPPADPVTPPAAPAERPPASPPAVAAAGPVPAQAVPTQLPSTGTSSWWLAMVAMGLVLAGSGFVSFGRRPS